MGKKKSVLFHAWDFFLANAKQHITQDTKQKQLEKGSIHVSGMGAVVGGSSPKIQNKPEERRNGAGDLQRMILV